MMKNVDTIRNKVLLGMLVLFFVCFGRIKTAEAETTDGCSGTEVEVTDSAKAENVDLNSVMTALSGRTIKNGDSFIVDNKFRVECKVTTDSPINSAVAADTYSHSYTGTLHAYVYFLNVPVQVAIITHNVSITFYDSGLVHINSGSLSVSPNAVNWTGSAFDYQIVNTDGTYSTSGGIAELHDTAGGGYYDYSCWVTINSGGSPMYTFYQIPR